MYGDRFLNHSTPAVLAGTAAGFASGETPQRAAKPAEFLQRELFRSACEGDARPLRRIFQLSRAPGSIRREGTAEHLPSLTEAPSYQTLQQLLIGNPDRRS
jgi:hypothetical protein